MYGWRYLSEGCRTCRQQAEEYKSAVREGRSPSDERLRELRASMVEHALTCESCNDAVSETVDAVIAQRLAESDPDWNEWVRTAVMSGRAVDAGAAASGDLVDRLIAAIDAAGRPIDAAEGALSEWIAAAAAWIREALPSQTVVPAYSIAHCDGDKEYELSEGLPSDWWCEPKIRFVSLAHGRARATIRVLPGRTPRTNELVVIIATVGDEPPKSLELERYDDAAGGGAEYAGEAYIPWESLGAESETAILLAFDEGIRP